MQKIFKNKIGRIVLIVFGCIVGLWGGAQFYDSMGIGKKEETERVSIEQLQDIAKQSAESLTLYENQPLGFRMQYPKNWETGDLNGMPYFEMKAAGVNVIYGGGTLTKDASANEVKEEQKATLLASYRSRNIPLTIVKEGATVMGGLPAYEWRTEYTRDKKQYIATQVWTVKNTSMHILTFSARSNELHDMFYPAFMKMVQTFEPL